MKPSSPRLSQIAVCLCIAGLLTGCAASEGARNAAIAGGVLAAVGLGAVASTQSGVVVDVEMYQDTYPLYTQSELKTGAYRPDETRSEPMRLGKAPVYVQSARRQRFLEIHAYLSALDPGPFNDAAESIEEEKNTILKGATRTGEGIPQIDLTVEYANGEVREMSTKDVIANINQFIATRSRLLSNVEGALRRPFIDEKIYADVDAEFTREIVDYLGRLETAEVRSADPKNFRLEGKDIKIATSDLVTKVRAIVPKRQVVAAQQAMAEQARTGIGIGSNQGDIVNEATQPVLALNTHLDIITDPRNRGNWVRINHAKSKAGPGNHGTVIYMENWAMPVVKSARFDPTQFVVASGRIYKSAIETSVKAFALPVASPPANPSAPGSEPTETTGQSMILNQHTLREREKRAGIRAKLVASEMQLTYDRALGLFIKPNASKPEVAAPPAPAPKPIDAAGAVAEPLDPAAPAAKNEDSPPADGANTGQGADRAKQGEAPGTPQLANNAGLDVPPAPINNLPQNNSPTGTPQPADNAQPDAAPAPANALPQDNRALPPTSVESGARADEEPSGQPAPPVHDVPFAGPADSAAAAAGPDPAAPADGKPQVAADLAAVPSKAQVVTAQELGALEQALEARIAALKGSAK